MHFRADLIALCSVLVLLASTKAEADFEGRRYAAKAKQASPGLYFDPKSGTFRATPPDAPLVRSLSQELLEAEESQVEAGHEHDLEHGVGLGSRGAKLATQAAEFRSRSLKLDKKYTPIQRASPDTDTEDEEVVEVPSRKQRGRARVRYSRKRQRARKLNFEDDSDVSASRPRYQHFDDASDVILPTRANQYLQEHYSKGFDHEDEEAQESRRFSQKRLAFNDDEWASNEIENSNSFDHSSRRKLHYDFEIQRDQVVESKTTQATTTTTTTTTRPFYPTRNSWSPSSKPVKFKTSSGKDQSQDKDKHWKPAVDRSKILAKFRRAYETLNSGNEIAQEYPKNEDEKFPHFPAKEKHLPRITRPTHMPKSRMTQDLSRVNDNSLASTAATMTDDAKPKSSRFDATLELDSFSTHSTSKNTFLPFENSRLRKNTPVLPRSESKKSFSNAREKRLKSPEPTSHDWAKKVDEDQGHRRPSVYTQYTSRSTTPSTTVTTTPPTTTTKATDTPRLITKAPKAKGYDSLVETFDHQAKQSPFSVIPVSLNPTSTLAPASKHYPALKNNPFLPPLMPGYGAPDLYGQLVPAKPKPLSSGLSYNDYFAYGQAPTLSTFRPTPTPLMLKTSAPKRLMTPSSSVAIKPYGEPVHQHQTLRENGGGRGGGSKRETRFPSSLLPFEKKTAVTLRPEIMMASPTERSVIGQTVGYSKSPLWGKRSKKNKLALARLKKKQQKQLQLQLQQDPLLFLPSAGRGRGQGRLPLMGQLPQLNTHLSQSELFTPVAKKKKKAVLQQQLSLPIDRSSGYYSNEELQFPSFATSFKSTFPSFANMAPFNARQDRLFHKRQG